MGDHGQPKREKENGSSVMSVKDVREWLSTLPDDANVAIDHGGLALVEVDGEAYIEVGGIPQDDVKLPVLKCKRPGCGHTWIPRRSAPPKVCPRCKQRDWNKPRKAEGTK